jgi:hypothetical protein
VVPNALKRYNLNNHSPLQKEPDGSLKIGGGPKAGGACSGVELAAVGRRPRGSHSR